MRKLFFLFLLSSIYYLLSSLLPLPTSAACYFPASGAAYDQCLAAPGGRICPNVLPARCCDNNDCPVPASTCNTTTNDCISPDACDARGFVPTGDSCNSSLAVCCPKTNTPPETTCTLPDECITQNDCNIRGSGLGTGTCTSGVCCKPVLNPPSESDCNNFVISPNPGPAGSTFNVIGQGCRSSVSSNYTIKIFANNGLGSLVFSSDVGVTNTASNFSIPISTSLIPGIYQFELKDSTGVFVNCRDTGDVCQKTLTVTTSGPLHCCGFLPGDDNNNCTVINILTDHCPVECPPTGAEMKCIRVTAPLTGTQFCNPATGLDALPGTPTATGVKTAIGCIDITGKATITTLLGFGTGLAGGIAILLLFYSGLKITMAHGDPKAIQAGKELMTSAIAGLILISLAIVILNFIGIKILNLPGFSP